MAQQDERLAVIEATAIATKDAVCEVRAMMSRLSDQVSSLDKDRIIEREQLKGEIKILRIGVALALLGGIGGGGSVLLKMLGIS